MISGKSAAMVATLNGKSTAPFAGVTKIVVHAGGGDDNVSLANVFVNATINGGPGHDRLLGSSADDVLNGGDGNDTLIGGLGVDALLGEAGDDTLDAIDGISDGQLNTGTGADRIRTDRIDPAAF